MKIFIFYCFLFLFSYSMEAIEKKIMNLNTDSTNLEIEKNHADFYLPTYQDYRFWTEENNLKKTLLNIESFSIEKYYSHNFFKHDNFGFFYNQGNGNNLLIPNRNNLTQRNLYHSQKMLFFKDPFFYREKIQYFDVQTPLSEIFYESDFFQKRGLGGFFSQSPNEKINYSIEYRSLNLKNNLDFDQNQDLLLTTFSYQDEQDEDDYKLWGHYIYQKFFIKEREKVIKWNNIKNYKNVFFDQKKFIHNRFYINFIQKIFPEKNKLFFLKTYMEYEKYSKNHFFSEQKNKINHFDLKNGLFLMFKKNKFEIEVGSIFDKIHYQLFLLNEYNNRITPKNKYINNFSIETQINYPINNIFKFHSHSKWTYNNSKKTYFQMNMKFNTFLFSKFDFSSQLYISENKDVSPDFIHLSILKENEDCYNNQRNNMLFFDKEKTIDFSLFYKKNFHVSFYISRLNHSFLDEKKEMEKFLYRKYVQSYGLKIKTTQDIWKFQFHNLLLYQKYNSDPLIFSIPNFLSRSTISYQDNYFNKALSIKTGISVHYFSDFYYQKIYYPFDIHLFPSEKECYPNKIGVNPFIDYFLNLKIYRTIFYISIQNIGFHSIYRSLNKKELFIRTGFSWTLFT
ncbi:putative porin [Blattabacterium cuenoti]|uniref:putative porin n=1 Tax=Blattabacterium cuenoti TaxID=1653831 RepID=UPI00163C3D96|nr:putative porin [Blattabacterium cuenoti]